ncbi:inner membrane protein [Escherichia coli]|nr:inner membrane protein [Escherichia coli]
MTYQQAGRIAVLKRILGWVIFIPALISTLISLLKFMNTRQENQEGINAVMLDFTHVMIDMMQANTPFLNLFWYNSPTPNFNGGVNVMFWVIFILILSDWRCRIPVPG